MLGAERRIQTQKSSKVSSTTQVNALAPISIVFHIFPRKASTVWLQHPGRQPRALIEHSESMKSATLIQVQMGREMLFYNEFKEVICMVWDAIFYQLSIYADAP